MRYDNGLTSNVQDYIASILAKKIAMAQSNYDLGKAAKDIRGYLADKKTLSTPDFVIRRFIQSERRTLLPKDAIIPDLRSNNNIEWSDEIIYFLADKLFHEAKSKKHKTFISKKEWIRYLKGYGVQDRERVFKVAFTLEMDIDATMDLLLSYNLEPYSARHPLDLICFFCQQKPGTYSWDDVTNMLDEYRRRTSTEYAPTELEKNQVVTEIVNLFVLEESNSTDFGEHLLRYFETPQYANIRNFNEAAKSEIMDRLIREVANNTQNSFVFAENATTADMIISFVSANWQRLLSDQKIAPDIFGLPLNQWDLSSKRAVLESLERHSKIVGADISATAWEQHLTGKSTTSKRKVFKLAFALQLDISGTQMLLQKMQIKPYSLDEPFDLIVLYCQNKKDQYNWRIVDALSKKLSKSAETTLPQRDMTRQITNEAIRIFNETLSEEDIDNNNNLSKQKAVVSEQIIATKGKASAATKIVDYMVEHCTEFPKFQTTTTDPYLPGYSLERLNKFIRLSQYLAVLYPKYRVVNMETDDKDEEREVAFQDGIPSLSDLVQSMFYNSEWKNIVWNGGKLDNHGKSKYISAEELANKWNVPIKRLLRDCEQARFAGIRRVNGKWQMPEDLSKPSEFEDHMYILCRNYDQHMRAVKRFREGGKRVSFFTRQDALLFIFFLIKGYLGMIDLLEYKPYEEVDGLDVLDEMLSNRESFDSAVALALDKAEYVLANPDDESIIAERFKTLIESFNILLTEMGYMNLYLPARFDRFVVLSLFSATPDELAPLIMSQEDYDEANN